MQKSILPYVVVSILLSPGVAVPQVERGDIEINFSARLGRGDSDSTGEFVNVSGDVTTVSSGDSWSFGAGASAGYFVSDHVSVGGFVDLGYFESDFTDKTFVDGVLFARSSSERESYSYSLGPLFNYHFRPSSKIVPFVGIAGGWFRGDSEFSSTGGQSDSEDDGWTLRAGGGADFFLNPHVALKLQLQYARFDRNAESSSQSVGSPETRRTTSAFEADSIDVLVGVAVFLHTKRP